MGALNLIAAGLASRGAQNDGGDEYRARTVLNGPRYRTLDRKQQYFDCTQHDWKQFDFDGRTCAVGDGGINATQPLVSSERVSYYVPLRQRRPSVPYRLSRAIVLAFTNMVFGSERFPTFAAATDPNTHDFIGALVEESNLALKLIMARNLGGAMGSVGLSWGFRKGKPRVRVHNAKNLFVHAWDDREELIPRHVTESYQYTRDEWNGEKRQFLPVRYWYRRDWTPNADILFKPTRVVPNVDPVFEIDETRSNLHEDGLTHFAWMQNLPNDDEIDGVPDYEGLYENFDSLDMMASVMFRGLVLNLDPTLKLKVDPMIVGMGGVKKGSDNALIVGQDGDAEYLEMSGTSITAGIALFNEKRRQVLETAQCVMPDPDQVASQGTSSVALKMLYAPMLGQVNQLRVQYGRPVARMLSDMGDVARARRSRPVLVSGIGEATGESTEQPPQEEAQQTLALPPKVVREPKLDDDGNPTGEDNVKLVDHDPGIGGVIKPIWPAYFPPTPADQNATITALSTAVGAQAFLSVQTAAEIGAEIYGRKAEDEWGRVQKQTAAAQQQAQAAFDDHDNESGGKVEHEQQLPNGATLKQSAGAKPKPPMMLGPDGKPAAPGLPPGKAADEDDPDAGPKPSKPE